MRRTVRRARHTIQWPGGPGCPGLVRTAVWCSGDSSSESTPYVPMLSKDSWQVYALHCIAPLARRTAGRSPIHPLGAQATTKAASISGDRSVDEWEVQYININRGQEPVKCLPGTLLPHHSLDSWRSVTVSLMRIDSGQLPYVSGDVVGMILLEPERLPEHAVLLRMRAETSR